MRGTRQEGRSRARRVKREPGRAAGGSRRTQEQGRRLRLFMPVYEILYKILITVFNEILHTNIHRLILSLSISHILSIFLK